MPAAYEATDLNRRFQQINQRLRAIEAQLALLSEKAGIDYDAPADEVPPDVVELAEAGKSMEAIKRYRELTNADFEKARDVVSGL
jgi:ribosomal protein L7/L12